MLLVHSRQLWHLLRARFHPQLFTYKIVRLYWHLCTVIQWSCLTIPWIFYTASGVVSSARYSVHVLKWCLAVFQFHLSRSKYSSVFSSDMVLVSLDLNLQSRPIHFETGLVSFSWQKLARLLRMYATWNSTTIMGNSPEWYVGASVSPGVSWRAMVLEPFPSPPLILYYIFFSCWHIWKCKSMRGYDDIAGWKHKPYCDTERALHAACRAWAFEGLLQLTRALCAGFVMLRSSWHFLHVQQYFLGLLAASSLCYCFNTSFAPFTLFPTAIVASHWLRKELVGWAHDS